MRERDNEKFWDQVWPIYSEFDIRAIALDEMRQTPLVVSIARALYDRKEVSDDLYERMICKVADRFGLETDHVDYAITMRMRDNLEAEHQQYMSGITEDA